MRVACIGDCMVKPALDAGTSDTSALGTIRVDRAPGLYAVDVDPAGELSFTDWRSHSAARALFEPPARVTPERLAAWVVSFRGSIILRSVQPAS